MSSEVLEANIKKKLESQELIKLGRAVLQTESEAIRNLIERIDQRFVKACQHLLGCEGRIVVLGMGKSGHIGSKIAATLASTGSPAFFVHPGEASHGDLGMITAKDVVIMISNSGETDELLTVLPLIKRLSVPMIAMTGKEGSTLAKAASIHLDVSVEKEACPLGLAPTASTTATLAMGDALAVALLEIRGFTEEDFARSHPGGSLGRRLLLHIEDIMQSGDNIPTVQDTVSVLDAMAEISRKPMGFTAIVNSDKQLVGIFTDGDLRRLLYKSIDLENTPVENVMTRNCVTIKADALAVEALKLMESKRVNGFVVVDDQNKVIGALNIHDLLHSGVA